MKIIDNMSYALLIEDNATCMTVGLYKVVGSDLKDLLPHIANFNKATAGKVWVGDPVEWGKIRAQTWRQIVAKRFDKNADYAHCAADGICTDRLAVRPRAHLRRPARRALRAVGPGSRSCAVAPRAERGLGGGARA